MKHEHKIDFLRNKTGKIQEAYEASLKKEHDTGEQKSQSEMNRSK